MSNHEAPEDRLELSLRIGGGEVFAITVESQSKSKGWIVVALISLAIVSIIVAETGPVLMEMTGYRTDTR